MADGSFLNALFNTIAERGRSLVERNHDGKARPKDLAKMCDELLSGLGEASGVARAEEILACYQDLNEKEKITFFQLLLERFGADEDAVKKAARAYLKSSDERAAQRLYDAVEPKRQELLRRLNLAPDGTARLVDMRDDLLKMLKDHPDFAVIDRDFMHLFASWFNRGFLVLRRIDWNTPAAILEKIIRYEAVHEIQDWNDLRSRIDPPDRRLYAFFHPRLRDDPLIFVEVALMKDMPEGMGHILNNAGKPLKNDDLRTAVFYSISNCQTGLRGISFGSFLIKQVAEDIKAELPDVKTYVTLSPIPGFARWLERERSTGAKQDSVLSKERVEQLKALDDPKWFENRETAKTLEDPLSRLAAWYLLNAKKTDGTPLDPVARFHLGNGAVLERINWLADKSEHGIRQSHGLMVNYLYDLDRIEENHEAYAADREVIADSSVRKLARAVEKKAGRKSREKETSEKKEKESA